MIVMIVKRRRKNNISQVSPSAPPPPLLSSSRWKYRVIVIQTFLNCDLMEQLLSTVKYF